MSGGSIFLRHHLVDNEYPEEILQGMLCVNILFRIATGRYGVTGCKFESFNQGAFKMQVWITY